MIVLLLGEPTPRPEHLSVVADGRDRPSDCNLKSCFKLSEHSSLYTVYCKTFTHVWIY